MIKGVGIDIIEVGRIEKLLESKENFLTRNFTEAEQEFNLKPESVAGNFAAKEAFAKSLGTGFRGFGLRDVEVLRNELGAPYIVFRGERSAANVSISHTKTTAVAVVIMV